MFTLIRYIYLPKILGYLGATVTLPNALLKKKVLRRVEQYLFSSRLYDIMPNWHGDTYSSGVVINKHRNNFTFTSMICVQYVNTLEHTNKLPSTFRATIMNGLTLETNHYKRLTFDERKQLTLY